MKPVSSEATRRNETVLSRVGTESGFCFGKVMLTTKEAGWITERKPHWKQSHPFGDSCRDAMRYTGGLSQADGVEDGRERHRQEALKSQMGYRRDEQLESTTKDF